MDKIIMIGAAYKRYLFILHRRNNPPRHLKCSLRTLFIQEAPWHINCGAGALHKLLHRQPRRRVKVTHGGEAHLGGDDMDEALFCAPS
jgi:hypothetical protein